MRTLVIVSTAILLVSLPAFAYHTRPYIGINLHLNSPTGDFADDEFAPGDGLAEGGPGLGAEIGMASRAMSAYIGLRGARFDTQEQPDWSGEWTTNRLVIGLRGHLFAEEGASVLPTIGGGITYGRTRLEQQSRVGDIVFISDDRSDPSIGWFLEGGLMAWLSNNAALLADLQYHSFAADFDFENNGNEERFDITFVTLQLGIAVMLSD